MAKSRTNWKSVVVVRTNGLSTGRFVVYGNTRKDLRQKLATERRETPFGVEHKTTSPVKVVIL